MTHFVDIAKEEEEAKRAQWMLKKVRIKQLPEPVVKKPKETVITEINVYAGQSVVRYRGRGREPERGTVQDVRGDKGTIIMVGVGWRDSSSGGGYSKLLRCRLNGSSGEGGYGVQHKVDGKWCYRTNTKKRSRDSWVPVDDDCDESEIM